MMVSLSISASTMVLMDAIADDGIMQEDEVVESLKICSEPLIYGPATDFIFWYDEQLFEPMC